MSPANEEKKRSSKTSSLEPQAAPQEGDDLGRIREILFGPQAQAFDSHLKTVETRALAETADLRSDLLKRLASLEDYIKGELNSLSERVRTEQDDRSRTFRQVTKELREGMEAVDKRLIASAAQFEEELRLLREQVLHYSQSVRDEIRAAGGEQPPASGPH